MKNQAKAFENLRELRKRIRYLHESIHYQHGMKEQLRALQQVVDTYAKDNPMLRDALSRERLLHSATTGSMNAQQQQWMKEAYKLVQVIPSFEAAPEGVAENKLRAIEALIKTKGGSYVAHQTFQAIQLIIDPDMVKKVAAAEAEAKKQEEKKKKKAQEALLAKKKAELEKKKKIPKPQGPGPDSYLKPVEKDHSGKPFGVKMPFSKIPDNAPVTWGSFSVWVEKSKAAFDPKQHKVFYVHPEWHKTWKKEQQLAAKATKGMTLLAKKKAELENIALLSTQPQTAKGE